MCAKARKARPKTPSSKLSRLDNLSLRLGSTLDMQTEASVLLDWIIEAGLTGAAVLFLADEAKENLDALAWRGVELPRDARLPIGEGLAQEICRLCPSFFDSVERILLVPLALEGELFGVLCVQRRPEAPPSPEENKLWDATAGIAVAILRNIQRHQNLEQTSAQLEESKKTERLKDDLISMASHDLKSPVTSIKGYAQLAAKQLGKGDLEKTDHYLEIIIRQVDQLNKLLDTLLDVSSIQAGKLNLTLEDLDLVALLDGIIERFSSIMGHHWFRKTVPPTSVMGYWDKSRLEQTLANLVGNAIKYSPEGGEIGLRVDARGSEAVVSISDQGIGIPKEEQERLFERFYRGQFALDKGLGGSGLGLYISHSVIQAHGGRIWVESEPGKGSTFFVVLPLHPIVR